MHITTIQTLRELTKSWREKNQRIALVPTMGNLHEGHLTLVKKAQELADHVIVSIFVNPLQFGPLEDFSHYPRTLEEDISKLATLRVDAVFAPYTTEIYPEGASSKTRVIVSDLSDDLCGKTRPGHFEGVATVVAKLFHIVEPHIALFGQKDFQQLMIIQKMVQDLNFPLEIFSVPTVRETDGLALSSRNQYLNETQRKIAPKLYETLLWAKEQIKSGNNDYEKLCDAVTKKLLAHGFEKIDYIAVREKDSLQLPLKSQQDDLIILAAAFLGKTRLIDNTQLT